MKNPYDNLAVLVIDMHTWFVKRLDPKRRKLLIEAQKQVLALCAEHDIRVWRVELDTRSFGVTVKAVRDAIRAVPRDHVLRKRTNSAFDLTKGGTLADTFDALGIEAAFLMGLNADVCARDTAREGRDRGFCIFSNSEVVASTESEHDDAVRELAYVGCQMIAFAELLGMLERYALSKNNEGGREAPFSYSAAGCPPPRCSHHHLKMSCATGTALRLPCLASSTSSAMAISGFSYGAYPTKNAFSFALFWICAEPVLPATSNGSWSIVCAVPRSEVTVMRMPFCASAIAEPYRVRSVASVGVDEAFTNGFHILPPLATAAT